MDSQIALVLIATVGILPAVTATIVQLLITRAQNRKIEQVAAVTEKAADDRQTIAVDLGSKIEAVQQSAVAATVTQAESAQKLETIHTLVNSRLSDAMAQIEELKGLLVHLAPRNRKVKAAVKRSVS